MSVLEFSVYVGFWRWKQDFRDKFIKAPWQDLEARYKSCNEANLTSKKPRDLTREDDKLRGPSQKSVESCETRSFVQFGVKLTTRAHMQKGEGSRRLGNRHHAKEAGNWAEVGPGRSAQAGRLHPFRGPVAFPFDLAAIRAIYSPRVESHRSIHSSSAAKEQRREGHHLREERVELVD
jgi:hypothetical protein